MSISHHNGFECDDVSGNPGMRQCLWWPLNTPLELAHVHAQGGYVDEAQRIIIAQYWSTGGVVIVRQWLTNSHDKLSFNLTNGAMQGYTFHIAWTWPHDMHPDLFPMWFRDRHNSISSYEAHLALHA